MVQPRFREVFVALMERRGVMSRYQMGQQAGLARSVITRILDDDARIDYSTAYSVLETLDASSDEREEVFGSILAERIMDQLDQYAIYHFLSTATTRQREQVIEFLGSLGAPTAPQFLNSTLAAIAKAEEPELIPLKERLVAFLVGEAVIDPSKRTVRVRDGELQHSQHDATHGAQPESP